MHWSWDRKILKSMSKLEVVKMAIRAKLRIPGFLPKMQNPALFPGYYEWCLSIFLFFFFWKILSQKYIFQASCHGTHVSSISIYLSVVRLSTCFCVDLFVRCSFEEAICFWALSYALFTNAFVDFGITQEYPTKQQTPFVTTSCCWS